MSLQAYSKAQRVAESPRDTEYRLFAEITRQLMDVKEMALHEPPVIQAVHRNKRLWSTLLADLSMWVSYLKVPSAVTSAVGNERWNRLTRRGSTTIETLPFDPTEELIAAGKQDPRRED